MDENAIVEAIDGHRAAAIGALAAIQSDGAPLTIEVIELLARREHRAPAKVWLDWLVAEGKVIDFVNALRARSVPIDEQALADADGTIPSRLLASFLVRAEAFRAQIVKNGEIVGSGVLVGPNLVLTAWHVIAVDAPGREQKPPPELKVVLADEKRHDARVPAVFESECGPDEYASRAPLRDAQVAGHDDVALLELAQPAPLHLGHVRLDSPAPVVKNNTPLVLVHLPGGTEKVINFGKASKIRDLSARWRHDVPTAGGSSGGACFDHTLHFIGIHQGEFDSDARFVPAGRFVDGVLAHVRHNVAPPSLWSLDGTVTGPLVIGRNPFFEAVAAAGEPAGRVRGVRVKRAVIRSGSMGLSYSYDILEQLLRRRGPEHRLVRITQDEIVDDLAAEIRRRARGRGIDLPDPPADRADGARARIPSEKTVKARAERLAADLEAAATASGTTVWLFIDNPTVALTESARLTIEMFVGAALTEPHLRVVVAGLETVTLPGREFRGIPPTDADRSPGLVVEYLGDFRRADVLDALTLASRELTGDVDLTHVAYATDRALVDVPHLNGLYDAARLATVAENLRPDLMLLARGRP